MAVIFLSLVLIFGLLTVLGRRIGATLFPNETKGLSTAIGVLLAVACFSLSGSAVYYLTSVNVLTLGAAAIATIGGIVYATRRWRSQVVQSPPQTLLGEHRGQTAALLLVTVISLAAWWQAILSTPIAAAARSPWLVLSPISIIAPAVALVASFVLLHREAKLFGSLALFATLFSIFASATALFPLGYGFDPFLHRATIAHIAEHGTITPKPLYYIGEYAIELFGNILGGIPIAVIDAFLVPLIAAITLTIAARRLPIGIAILLIALSNFVTTTPQSLAYLFTILTIVTVPKAITRYRDLVAPSIFALAALITHPIAGVPACFFVAFCATRTWNPSVIKTAARSLLTIGAALALPMMFAAQAVISHAPVSFSLSNLWKLNELPLSGFLFSHGSTWLDGMYLVVGNLSSIILVLGLAGIIMRRRSKTPSTNDSGILMMSLFVSFIIVSLGIDFSYLINYERQDFALRLLLLATIFALPIADETIRTIVDYAGYSSRSRSAAAFVALFIVSTATVYGLYPRHDGYVRSAAFNVSQADFDTVYAIHQREADNADYIVLSNQATAAAALQEFGFRKYYHTDIFYYPIPTGGALYQSYLSMVNTAPTKETVGSAMALAGVPKAYFVVSDYWWKSDAIIENAKQQTDDWFAVDGGKTTVFIFTNEESAQ
ncbi:MAG: hypothetical protein AAB473_02020 [Patescibacteria group bacterium]